MYRHLELVSLWYGGVIWCIVRDSVHEIALAMAYQQLGKEGMSRRRMLLYQAWEKIIAAVLHFGAKSCMPVPEQYHILAYN